MSNSPAPPPPEWAPHEAVWIGFPSDPELWLGDLKAAEREVAAFAKAVHTGGKGEKVRLVAAHDDAAASARDLAPFAEVVVEFLPTERGGRRTPVYLSTDSPAHYRPHFRVCDGDGEYLGGEFVDGPDDPVVPGGSTYATVRFVYEPEVSYDALVVGAQFEVMEGSRVVATGRVTRR